MENKKQARQEFYNEFILSNPYITEWENKFIVDIIKQNKPLSDKQRNIFNDIYKNKIPKYIQLKAKQQNGYCKPTTLRVVRYKG